MGLATNKMSQPSAAATGASGPDETIKILRVWLLDDRHGHQGGLETSLKQLEATPGLGLRLLGASPYEADFASAMAKLAPDLLDVLVIHEPAWPQEGRGEALLELGLGLLIVTRPDGADRFRDFTNQHPVVFLPETPTSDALWLGLLGASANRRCQAGWKAELASLRQRLNDRIVIERAKGILVRQLGISEEDAYRRLRVLSRRQRRQMREIAQSLLDTQVLFAPEPGGAVRSPPPDEEP
jgi:response regulator NasT